MDEVYTDGFGNYFDAQGRPLSVYDLIGMGINVAGAWAGKSPYVAPNDPRYRPGQPTYNPGQPCDPRSGARCGTSPDYSPVNVNTQGFQMPWWATVGLIALGVAYISGKGRR